MSDFSDWLTGRGAYTNGQYPVTAPGYVPDNGSNSVQDFAAGLLTAPIAAEQGIESVFPSWSKIFFYAGIGIIGLTLLTSGDD